MWVENRNYANAACWKNVTTKFAEYNMLDMLVRGNYSRKMTASPFPWHESEDIIGSNAFRFKTVIPNIPNEWSTNMIIMLFASWLKSGYAS